MNEIGERFDELHDAEPGPQRDPLRFFFQMGAMAAMIDFLRLCVEGEKPMDAVYAVNAHIHEFAADGERGTLQ